MGFNKFVLNILVRSVLIALTALTMMLFAIKLEWFFTFAFLCILFFFQIYLLIRYISKINRDLANFLIHLKEQNTSLNLSSSKINSLFGNLSHELDRINQQFKSIENEKIRKQNFINVLLNRVGTGILVIDREFNVKLYNQALLKLFDLDKDSIEKIKAILENYRDLDPGEQNIENIRINNITRKILISNTEIKENNEVLKIFTFHDIDREMTDYELQSWNGIIKVLSHEILNTLTPMSTTVDTIKDCLTIDDEIKSLEQIEETDLLDATKGIKLIENRVNGLQDFIKKFRQFLDIPLPELKDIDISKVIKEVTYPYEQKINITYNLDELSIKADQSLLELVIINIIKNSIEANASKLRISANNRDKYIVVEISDNGDGIDPSLSKKIFLPFYTTKEGGSGIGLSLARQIMFAHKGDIQISSNKTGTSISLYFRKEMS